MANEIVGDIVLAAYFVPGVGPRSASVALCLTPEDADRAIDRAFDYAERTGWKSLVIDTMPYNEFLKNPRGVFLKLREKAMESYANEYPEELMPEEQIEEEAY